MKELKQYTHAELQAVMSAFTAFDIDTEPTSPRACGPLIITAHVYRWSDGTVRSQPEERGHRG